MSWSQRFVTRGLWDKTVGEALTAHTGVRDQAGIRACLNTYA
jgi:hypothetical protein